MSDIKKEITAVEILRDAMPLLHNAVPCPSLPTKAHSRWIIKRDEVVNRICLALKGDSDEE